MKTTYIIYDIKNNECFVGCNDDGKPTFSNLNEDRPINFDSEEMALKRLDYEIQLFGDLFLENRLIEVKNIYFIDN